MGGHIEYAYCGLATIPKYDLHIFENFRIKLHQQPLSVQKG